jgi:CHAD domain-containing protein
MLECLAKPAKRSVHKLRTSTRRIEAQLELLSMLPELPRHIKPRQKLLRLLKKLRQAAGEVRDLDVQRDLVAETTPKKHHSRSVKDIRKEADQLRQELKQKRASLAAELVSVLKQEQEDLPLAFKELFDSLESVGSLTVSEADLTSLINTWYGQHTPATAPEPTDVEHLHDIRKYAKLARYLAESAPPEAGDARRLATRFEDLQEAGGQWHDWLLLAEIAREQLGASAELPTLFASRAQKCLKTFERRIEKMNTRKSRAHAKAA